MASSVNLPIHTQAFQRLVQAVQRKNFETIFLAGSIPVIGAIPSAAGVIGAAARIIDRVAMLCFRGIKAAIGKDPHRYELLQDAKRDVADYFLLCFATTVGVCTLGISNMIACNIALRGCCGGDDDF